VSFDEFSLNFLRGLRGRGFVEVVRHAIPVEEMPLFCDVTFSVSVNSVKMFFTLKASVAGLSLFLLMDED